MEARPTGWANVISRFRQPPSTDGVHGADEADPLPLLSLRRLNGIGAATCRPIDRPLATKQVARPERERENCSKETTTPMSIKYFDEYLLG